MKLLYPFIIGAGIFVTVRAFDPTARATRTACAAGKKRGGAKTMAGLSPAHEAAHA
jgi:hypothetical protein